MGADRDELLRALVMALGEKGLDRLLGKAIDKLGNAFFALPRDSATGKGGDALLSSAYVLGEARAAVKGMVSSAAPQSSQQALIV